MQTNGKHRALIFSVIAAQVTHAGMFLVLKDATFASNVIQGIIALLCTIICMVKAKQASRAGLVLPWSLLAGSLSLWVTGQSLFTVLLIHPHLTQLESISNILWLLFSFPILLASFLRMPGARRERDGTKWLDFAQSFLFLAILFALVFSRPAIISLSKAYEVQSVALALAFALRFSVSAPGEERLFYRDAAVFSISYAVFSIIGYVTESFGFPSGTFTDLCWTVPFTLLSLLAIWPHKVGVSRGRNRRLLNSSVLHGICAFGLATMSLAASCLFAVHRPLFGGFALLVAFLLLAARMMTRELQFDRIHKQLEERALCDPLTGLANRTALECALAELTTKSHGCEHLTVALFIDLDRFKLINDGFGHHFGDLVLKQVASLLRLSTRKQDLVARQGGDEFVVLLNDTTLAEAQHVADKIGTLIKAPMQIDGQIIHLSASVGVASSYPKQDGATILENADCAMYNAKALGRDRIERFTPELLIRAKTAHTLHATLREALAADQITVQYQPIYDCRGTTVRGFEALARWCHPQRGFISPTEFIPVAEDTGLIVDLGLYVLRVACAQCQEWVTHFDRELVVSVNVSARQLADPRFIASVMEVLAASGLKPQLLRLEITETVLLGEGIGELLLELRNAGITVALDDFGTGYSSLSYLMNFPFDIVKIDRSFISNINLDYRRSEIVRKVVELASLLGMKTIAEGVEEPEELRCLQDLGCDMVQGYLLARPLVPELLFALLYRQESTSETQLQDVHRGALTDARC